MAGNYSEDKHRADRGVNGDGLLPREVHETYYYIDTTITTIN
jgi:hypothetical protein